MSEPKQWWLTLCKLHDYIKGKKCLLQFFNWQRHDCASQEADIGMYKCNSYSVHSISMAYMQLNCGGHMPSAHYYTYADNDRHRAFLQLHAWPLCAYALQHVYETIFACNHSIQQFTMRQQVVQHLNHLHTISNFRAGQRKLCVISIMLNTSQGAILMCLITNLWDSLQTSVHEKPFLPVLIVYLFTPQRCRTWSNNWQIVKMVWTITKIQ